MDQYITFKKFYELCRQVGDIFEKRWKEADENEKQQMLEQEKKAIMGYEKETEAYKSGIREVIEKETACMNTECPPWYPNLADGIFAELYGLAGIAPWAYDETEEYENSSSAKIIGDRIYCLIGGISQLQPQRISRERRQQLKRALLMAYPKERVEKGFHEIYLRNGIRITIYSGDRTKDGQDIMVFRKYIVRELTFEKLAALGTVPPEGVELFKVMVRLGFNVLFIGQVRAGKTVFMQTWQRYECRDLEGLAISTDPETPWHEIMTDAPIMQIVADGKELDDVAKSMLRGDNDYILLEEMRDADAFKLAVDITSAGTRRTKATMHAGSAQDVPYKMASAITARYGGSEKNMIAQIYRNFHYVFELCQMPSNRAKKLLNTISEYRYDPVLDSVSVHEICRYDHESGRWRWKYDIGEDKREMGKLQPDEFKKMDKMLKTLENRNPVMENTVIYPRYYSGGKDKDVH